MAGRSKGNKQVDKNEFNTNSGEIKTVRPTFALSQVPVK
jgi:hypothetical protein